MKKTLILIITFSFFLATALMLQSCKNGDGKSKTENKPKVSEEALSEADRTQIGDAVNEICDCISDQENVLSDATRDLFIKAGKASQPKTAFKEEIAKITDSSELVKVTAEMKAFEQSGVSNCIENIKKKYPAVKSAGKQGSKTLSEMVGENCSEFAAAVLRMGR